MSQRAAISFCRRISNLFLRFLRVRGATLDPVAPRAKMAHGLRAVFAALLIAAVGLRRGGTTPVFCVPAHWSGVCRGTVATAQTARPPRPRNIGTRMRHPVLHVATPFGKRCGPGGRHCVLHSSHAHFIPAPAARPPHQFWPCARACLTGGRSTVCAGRCVHRAGQRLQRHDLLLHAGLLLLRSSIRKAFASPHSHTHTHTHARGRFHTTKRKKKQETQRTHSAPHACKQAPVCA
jgi:hypothetical protein